MAFSATLKINDPVYSELLFKVSAIFFNRLIKAS